jgi:hypothetical protein
MKISLGSDFISFSAKKVARKSTKVSIKNTEQDYTIDKMLPVMLEPAEMKSFVTTFHPKRGGPNSIYDRMSYLLEMNRYISSVFEGLRAGILSYANVNTLNPEQLGQVISGAIDSNYKAGADPTAVRSFMETMQNGRNLIIRDSTRFKGGKDVLYVGARGPNQSPLLSIGRSPNYVVTPTKSSYSYEKNKAAYESDFGKAILETADSIQTLVFGEKHKELSAAYSRINKQYTFVEVASWVEAIIALVMRGPMAKMGISVVLPVFEAKLPETVLAEFDNYFSVLSLREPLNQFVSAKLFAKNNPDESLNISTEYLSLQPDVRFSISANLPQRFCEYITQTKDEQIPLVPLNTWAVLWSSAMFKPPHTRTKKGTNTGGDRITPFTIPRYVLRPSSSDALIERRKELGLYTEPGRLNDDGILITARGDVAALVPSDVSAKDNALQYEKLFEEILQTSFDAGAPVTGGLGSSGNVYDLASESYAQKIADLKSQLHKYRGTVQAVNWDLNTVLSVSATDPDRIVKTPLLGANKPDAHNLAVYLRGNFSRTMRDMFSLSGFGGNPLSSNGARVLSYKDFDDVGNGVDQSSLFKNFAMFYNYLLEIGKVPDLKTLVSRAAEVMKIKSLTEESVADYELNPLNSGRSIYAQIISPELDVFDPEEKTGQAILALLRTVANQASAKPNTNVARICMRDNIEVTEHERFFDGSISTLGEFSRLYTWLGGQVFFQAVQAVLEVPKQDLMKPPVDGVKNVNASYTSFSYITYEILPMCVMLGKYTMPEVRDKIFKESDELKEAEQNFGETDLNIAGSKGPNAEGKGGFKLFPHQAEALTKLKAHPKIAILDIAAGGGKTTIGLSDIAMLYADGLIKRPFVFCPNNLVHNWMEDLSKSFNGWNAIPVTTQTFNLWGEERLTDLIMNAPANTIVIISMQFLSHSKRRNGVKPMLVLGNAVLPFSHAVEFCKKFSPDYVFIDESHRIRNTNSSLHNGIKAINQMSSVKYGRIGTGTLIQNVMSDVVGQSSIFNGQIFRTKDEFNSLEKVESETGKLDYRPDTPARSRRRLAEFATIISARRRDWAFMLPIPVETFITLKMNADEFGEDGKKMQLLYEAVLNETLDEVNRTKKESASDEDSDDDEEQTSSGSSHKVKFGDSEIQVGDDEDDDDDDEDEEIDTNVKARLEIIERILTDPFNDDKISHIVEKLWGKNPPENYVTPKVQTAIKRIKNHFADTPWQKGATYKAGSIVDFNGKTYIFKPDLRYGSEPEESHHDPEQDTEKWKPQIKGKVFITCRFTRSVLAIYRALPEEYKKQCVMYYGGLADRDNNLSRFQNDPKIKILVANEQAVSEGHNFQAASRFIRLEAPWAPGELDQTMSRIFRPDVGGEYTRQSIFIDWILCDQTLEVAKMGRLVSKMLRRAQFDELENPNPKYYKDLNPANLESISMSIDNIRNLNRIEQLMTVPGDSPDYDENGRVLMHPHSYIGQYQYLVGEQGAEFLEMRKTRKSTMSPVEPTPLKEDAKSIEYYPWVPNLKVEDAKDEGLVHLRSMLEGDSELAEAFRKDHKVLIGQLVRTEFGLGRIVKATLRHSNGATETEDEEDSSTGHNVLSKVNVEFLQGGGIMNFSPSKVYLTTKLTEAEASKRNKAAPKITDADRKRTEKAQKIAEEKLNRIRQREASARKRTTVEKPIAPKKVEKPEVEKSIRLYPIVINKLLALMAEGVDNDVEDIALRRYGFKRFGDYAFLQIPNYVSFTAALDYLEKKYTLDPKLVAYLDMLHDSFQSGRGRKFNIELAPTSEIPIFYREHTRLVQQKPGEKKLRVRVYPVIVNESLMLAVDLTTNPQFRRQLNKPIPGMPGKNNAFKVDTGMFVQVVKNVSSLKATVKQLRVVGGFKVENIDDLKEQVAGLSFRPAKN